MSRKLLSCLTLVIFLLPASGAALRIHELFLEPGHSQQNCSVCQDLLAGSNALVAVATSIPAPAAVVAIIVAPTAQQPAVPALPPAIAPRGPPLA